MKRERRYKTLSIDQQLILDMVRGMIDNDIIRLPDLSNILPDDAELIDVRVELSKLAFGFLVYSKDFDVVDIGYEIPVIDYTMRTFSVKKSQVQEIL